MKTMTRAVNPRRVVSIGYSVQRYAFERCPLRRLRQEEDLLVAADTLPCKLYFAVAVQVVQNSRRHSPRPPGHEKMLVEFKPDRFQSAIVCTLGAGPHVSITKSGTGP
jgi:hypothetical protein